MSCPTGRTSCHERHCPLDQTNGPRVVDSRWFLSACTTPGSSPWHCYRIRAHDTHRIFAYLVYIILCEYCTLCRSQFKIYGRYVIYCVCIKTPRKRKTQHSAVDQHSLVVHAMLYKQRCPCSEGIFCKVGSAQRNIEYLVYKENAVCAGGDHTGRGHFVCYSTSIVRWHRSPSPTQCFHYRTIKY